MYIQHFTLAFSLDSPSVIIILAETIILSNDRINLFISCIYYTKFLSFQAFYFEWAAIVYIIYMAQLNANTPYIECFIRNSYVFGNDDEGLTQGYIFWC